MTSPTLQRSLRLIAALLASQLLGACIVLPVPMRPPRVIVIEPHTGHDGESSRDHRHRRDRHHRY